MPGESSFAPEPGDSVFFEADSLCLIDQTALPTETVVLHLKTPEETACAIRRLAVRGAMAIAVAGAYGVLLGALAEAGGDAASMKNAARDSIRVIGASRPTARNLFWALERMGDALEEGDDDPSLLLERLRERADEIALETIEKNRLLVGAGQEVVSEKASVLTHCNSGALAALRYGSALGVIIEAHRKGKDVHVYVDETRPLLQGSRLTAWELDREGVPFTLIPDNAAGFVMKQGLVDLVITGADRIASNGDTANKIGTYSLAVLSRAHGIPFYIAAPGSTVDWDAAGAADIVIEERGPEELITCGDKVVAPEGTSVYNPAFDITTADYIEGIITEKGVLRRPYGESLKALLE
ncbi:MAG: S-methyl-5-thioribose-1-phosphate isomerase [Actinobacteria bacterium]|nr:S-methyl-5-thioribose-1-phosphate isomerase [Actinomycetota bacterium]